ncbi:IclR family transcriptional regulator [Variovorax dokdonensis]|uniref:IclR family transcriptional regulator n=1 Tax=Variovorax dokdonensis TaxID=344883 RepID=A0ABT7N9X6_9BURK|nr:IclR family transcriptional regulator [Variovorax dokdonensis]MDM0044718.1 IclR family transcriptional regulator [Variovorax dokdonensis]
MGNTTKSGKAADPGTPTDQELATDARGAAQRGIQSIEVGGQLLRALVHHGRSLALKDLAREADMTAAKAHPYLVSFGRLGLIEQDPGNGHYQLGPLALQLGLISLQQANPVQVAGSLAAQLAQTIGQTVAIVVWGARGATIVQIAESPTPVHVNMRHGTVFSLTETASGKLFGAFRDPAEVQHLLEDERMRAQRRRQDAASSQGDGATGAMPNPLGMPAVRPLPSWEAFSAQLEEVRQRGLSRSQGEVIPGVNAMAAPVFNHAGEMVLALTAIGPAGVFDIDWDGPVAQAMRDCARAISQRLGAR